MAEKDTVFKGKIKNSGIFDFKDFYSFTYDWLMSEDYDVIEKTYSEKISGDSKDLEIVWEASKKVSDYFQFMIKVEWKIFGMKKVKVKKGEKEVTMDSGSTEIKFNGVLIKDYEHRWETNAFSKFLRGIYDRYIIRPRITDYENKLLEDINEIIAQCKSYLSMEGKR